MAEQDNLPPFIQPKLSSFQRKDNKSLLVAESKLLEKAIFTLFQKVKSTREVNFRKDFRKFPFSLSPQIPFLGTKHSLGPPHVFAKMPLMYLSSETEHKSLIVADVVHLCKKMVNFI